MNNEERLRDLRILIVEDDKDTREILRFILEQSAAQVIAVSSVTAAIESYKASAPDVIVADIAMPEYNGYALISLIQALEKKSGKNTPVIALTAYTSPADEETALAAGFRKYMSKPFEPAAVIEAIRNVIS